MIFEAPLHTRSSAYSTAQATDGHGRNPRARPRPVVRAGTPAKAPTPSSNLAHPAQLPCYLRQADHHLAKAIHVLQLCEIADEEFIG